MDNIEKIKSRLDIVDLIQGYLKVNKAGANYKARCPFHNEKTPSFMISPERQIWHCFGCGKGGDMFGFIKEIEGVDFSESLKILADRAGIELKSYDKNLSNERTRLLEISSLAEKFFIKQLYNSDKGKRALEYLKSRGLKIQTIKEWGLGFAPNSPNALSSFLAQSGYANLEIGKAGLNISARGNVFDRFQSRITFPIRDVNSRPVGFTGRIFEVQDEGNRIAKYINTPQTIIYDKGNLLYGLDKAKADIRREDRCVVVEGNMDVIMSHQVGVKNVVASSGTALTDSQLKILKRYSENLILSFDQDEAGENAMKRGIDSALQIGFNISLLDLDEGEVKDPADLIQANPAMWPKKLENIKSIVQFYFDKTFNNYDSSTAEGKKNITNVLLPLIKNILNKVEQSHWLTKLSSRLKVRDEILWRQMEVTNITPSYVRTEETDSQITTKRQDILEEAFLSILIKNLKLAKDKKFPTEEFSDFTKEVLDKIKKASIGDFDFGNFTKLFTPEMALQLEFIYIKSQELWKEKSDQELDQAFNEILNKLNKRTIITKLTSLEFDIKEAEELKSQQKIKTLLTKFNSLTQQLNLINNA